MATVHETRRKNLDFLLEQYGSIAKLNEVLGRRRTDSTLSQIRNQIKVTGKDSPRNMGSYLARTIEIKLNLPDGWMDEEHPEKLAVKEIKNKVFKENTTLLIPLLDEIPIDSDISNLDDSIKGVNMSDLMIEQYFPGVPKRYLRTFTVPDNSGMPTIAKGNFVILNTSIKKFEGDGWYLVNVQGFRTLRRIFYDFRGGFKIESGDASPQFVENLNYVNIEAKIVFAWIGLPL